MGSKGHAGSSLPPISFKYDLFVSFRGADSRDTITRALVRRLKDQGMEAFFDEFDLEKGEKIESLFNAIRNSNVFVLIISEHYGDSRWCMKELREILNTGRRFIPVFYGVDPKDVRHQTGAFGDAYVNGDAMKESGKLIVDFTKALIEVGSTSGHVMDINDEREQEQVIQNIVEQVSRIVRKAPFVIPKHVIGIDTQLSRINGMFKNDSVGAQVIGIHGIGGMGKTTLALGVYNNICHGFSASIFLENIREGVERNGMCAMQEKLLRGLVKDDGIIIDSIEKGKGILKRRLSSRCVLIVLDDISNPDQLKALAEEPDWFGNGSKLLITTRNSDVLLHQYERADIFELEKLDEHASLMLFSNHAFGESKPPKEFGNLSEAILKIADGVPLFVEVYGCHLKDKTEKEYWETYLRTIKGIPSHDIYGRLEISVNDLHVKERSIFLDIACFFIGHRQEIVVKLWKDSDDVDGLWALEKLAKRALLKVDEKHNVRMHDVIRDMARNIVKKDGEYHSTSTPKRIWDCEVAKGVLQHKIGIEKVEGMILNAENSPKSLDTMQNLRILQVQHGKSQGRLRELPQSLELLDWKYCAMDHVPSSWKLGNIVILNLSGSKLKKWSPNMMLRRLRLLDLSHSKELKIVGGFHNSPKLSKLMLDGCMKLKTLHDSIGLELQYSLTLLSMNDCQAIRCLPESIGKLEKLEQLLLNDCVALKSLPQCIGNAKSLKVLQMRRCVVVEALPSSVGSLSQLEELDLRTTRISNIPDSIGNLKNLRILCFAGTWVKQIPPPLSSLEKLEELHFGNNPNIYEVPENILGSLENLRKLDASNCKFKVLPNDLCRLSSLGVLNLRLNKALESLPERLGALRSLRELDLSQTSIERLPESISLLQSLQNLNLNICAKLKSLPNSSIGKLTGLRTLSLQETVKLESLPSSIGELSSLTKLDLYHSAIKNLPESIRCLQKLEELNLGRCSNLRNLPSVRELKDLRALILYGSGIKEIHESKLPLQMVEAMIMSSFAEKEACTNVFVNMCPHDDQKKSHLSNILGVKKFLRELGISAVSSDDKSEWLSKDSSWRRDYMNTCNAFVVILSERYFESEDCLIELEMILDSVTNDNEKKITKVHDNIDMDFIFELSRSNPRWRNAVDGLHKKVNVYYDSRDFKDGRLEAILVEKVICELEGKLGMPFIPLIYNT